MMASSIQTPPQRNWNVRLSRRWRKQFKQWWQTAQWPVIWSIGVLALGLGCFGFSKHAANAGEMRSPFDLFYLTLQLFVLESGAVSGDVPWQLELARWLAPTVAAYTAAMALAKIFSEQLQLLRMRFINDQVVICGLGRMGLLLAQTFHEHGLRVVVIEKDDGNDDLERCREQGIIVFVGDATSREMLRKARLHQARYLVSVCGNDGANVEVAVRARELVESRKSGALTCLVHIVELQLCNLLREHELVTNNVDPFRLEFFNVFESGARALLKTYPIIDQIHTDRRDEAHVLIVGLGRMGESLVVRAARDWRAISNTNGKPLRITVIDKEAKQKIASLHFRYPSLHKVCDLVAKAMDVFSPEFEEARFMFDPDGRCDVSMVYVCFDNDSRSLSVALMLHRRIMGQNLPIVVRLTRDAGLATLLQEGDSAGSRFENLHAFGLLTRTCKPDLLLGGVNEMLAVAIHEDYVRHQESLGKTPETNPAMVPWEELPESLKESNRHQASHFGVKLKAVGCGIAPLTDWEAEGFEFTAEEIERMAQMEHERWNAERRREGWRYAPGSKNIEKKTTPHLVPWEDLSEEIKELDRKTVRGMPAFLARAGYQVYRVKGGGNA
jgi:hypothetical protein